MGQFRKVPNLYTIFYLQQLAPSTRQTTISISSLRFIKRTKNKNAIQKQLHGADCLNNKTKKRFVFLKKKE